MRSKIFPAIKFAFQLFAVLAITSLVISITALPAYALPGDGNPTADENAEGTGDSDSNLSHLPISKGIYETGDIPKPPEKTGQQILKDLVLGALAYAKVIVGAIGILYITILGYQLIHSMGNDEDIAKAKRGLIYTLIAFILVSMSDDFGKIFDMEKSTILQSPQEILKRVKLFDKQVEIFMTFVKYTITGFAAIMVVQAGVKLVTSGGDDEEVTKNKKNVMYSAGGLVLIYVGDIFINKVFYKVDKQVYTGITGVHPAINAKEGVEQIAGITNFVISFAGPIAALMLVAGAIMYATAGGEEEKMNEAKRLIIATLVGIVIMYGAFALISTIISSKLTAIGAIGAPEV